MKSYNVDANDNDKLSTLPHQARTSDQTIQRLLWPSQKLLPHSHLPPRKILAVRISRPVKRREFGKLWIQRLNAGVRQHDVLYSNFINTQSKSGVVLDRKILSGLAMHEPISYKAVVDVVKMTAAAGAGK